MERSLYRIARIAGDYRALSRSPQAYVRRRIRSKAVGMFARFMRQVVKP